MKPFISAFLNKALQGLLQDISRPDYSLRSYSLVMCLISIYILKLALSLPIIPMNSWA